MPTPLNKLKSIQNHSDSFYYLFLLIMNLVAISGLGQLPFVVYNEVQLTKEGSLLQNPWAGGLNSPQFSVIDLDGDGLKDLVAFERGDYGVFKTFRNNGTSGTVDYTYAPEFQHQFPRLHNWALLVDYNCDGHEDLFASVPAGLKVYRNNYSEVHGNQFVLETPLLFAEGLNGQDVIYVSPPDLPAITDVDGDGDIDILSFEILGNHVAYFKNRSIENFGDCDHLEFELKNNCWGYFSEDATNNSINLYDTCEVNVIDPEKSGKHAGSTLLGFDANGDGVTDLALGDISYKTMTLLTNGGSVNSAGMVNADYNFPSNTIPVNMMVFPAAYLLDANNDGKRDLLVAPNNPNTSDNYDNIWYYENTGSDDLPAFSFQQTDFLQASMVDVGEGAFAVFFDENADGLIDVMIGNRGYFVESGVLQSQIALIRNTGTAQQPFYEWITDDYQGFSAFGMNGMYPTFGDMDNDGDEDMITGDEEGMLHYFRNDGGAGNPADFTLSQPNFKNIDVGQSAKPQIIDVNRDGSPDLIVGRRDGRISYFENTGSPESPDFSSAPTSDFFGGVDVMPACCTGFSAPFITEDSTGKYMMYVGSESGILYLFNNIENNLQGNFNPVDSLYIFGQRVNVSAFDINNDGKQELVSGKFAGGLAFFKNGVPQVFGIDEQILASRNINIYPNPAKDFLYVNFREQLPPENLKAEIMNIYGSPVSIHDLISSSGKFYFDVSALPPGIYLLKVSVGISHQIYKFVKQ